ncbi:hypothetical protein MLPF_1988 [Mycobacterium lepromatosis]|nr:hypothetical protein MLPF_1988 [Mycobacterium lepromatosis]
MDVAPAWANRCPGFVGRHVLVNLTLLTTPLRDRCFALLLRVAAPWHGRGRLVWLGSCHLDSYTIPNSIEAAWRTISRHLFSVLVRVPGSAAFAKGSSCE